MVFVGTAYNLVTIWDMECWRETGRGREREGERVEVLNRGVVFQPELVGEQLQCKVTLTQFSGNNKVVK